MSCHKATISSKRSSSLGYNARTEPSSWPLPAPPRAAGEAVSGRKGPTSSQPPCLLRCLVPRRRWPFLAPGGLQGLGSRPGCHGGQGGPVCRPGGVGASLDALRAQAAVALSGAWAQPGVTSTLLGSVNGDVRFFDPRMPESVNVLQIVKGLTALDIHPQADLIAW